MPREIATEIEIEAPPERVWRAISHAPGYSEWNPFIRRVWGEVREGETFHFVFHMAGLKAKAKATVLVVEPPRELRWAGNFLSGWLFRAEHYHVCEPAAGGRTRFVHGESFTGIMAPLVWPILRKRGRQAYVDLNEALKEFVEGGS